MAKTPNLEEPTTNEGAATAGSFEGVQWFGHPRGLATLFFTEMWERFSYYGMRAILMLFMTATVMGENPGLGLDIGKAAAIYGLFTSLVYILTLPGGWIADNLWGQRRAVFVGGAFIAAGNFCLVVPGPVFFYLGLLLIIVGTGLLKPNVSTMVGDLYPEGGGRRDAGFSIFYMGINIGAFIAPFIVGGLGEGFNWHWGFAASGVGMTLGLVQYQIGFKHLGTAGLLRSTDSREVLGKRARMFYLGLAGVVALAALLIFLALTGVLPITLQGFATAMGYAVIAMVILFFAYLLLAGGYNSVEKKRLGVILWLFLLAATFWAGFEQAGTSLNLFARDLTDRSLFGWEAPASFLQAINPVFIIAFAPVFGWLWLWLTKRNANPSIPLKFAFGLLGLTAGFLVIMWGALNATPDNLASPAWLVVTYFFFTVGELALSPVGLSSITKLSPKDRVGQMMGIWFVGAAMGNLFAGLVAAGMESMVPSALFRSVALFTGGAALLAFLLSPVIKKWTGGVQ